MSPKEKAKRMFDKYLPHMHPFIDHVAIKQAKKCALIAIDEILFAISKANDYQYQEYYEQVKIELEKL